MTDIEIGFIFLTVGFLSLSVGVILSFIGVNNKLSLASSTADLAFSVGQDNTKQILVAGQNISRVLDVCSTGDRLNNAELNDLRQEFQDQLLLLTDLVKNDKAGPVKSELPSSEELATQQKKQGENALAVTDHIKMMNALAAFVHMAIMQKRACPCYGRPCTKCPEISKAMQLLPDGYFKEHYHE